jgi:hypothetical protein
MTLSKFASADCTVNSIPTRLSKSAVSRLCNNDVAGSWRQHFGHHRRCMIDKCACVPVCDAALVLPTLRPAPPPMPPPQERVEEARSYSCRTDKTRTSQRRVRTAASDPGYLRLETRQ